jgi:hypothetical protein
MASVRAHWACRERPTRSRQGVHFLHQDSNWASRLVGRSSQSANTTSRRAWELVRTSAWDIGLLDCDIHAVQSDRHVDLGWQFPRGSAGVVSRQLPQLSRLPKEGRWSQADSRVAECKYASPDGAAANWFHKRAESNTTYWELAAQVGECRGRDL